MDADELHALALSRPTDALRIARDVLAGAPSDAEAAAAHHAAGVVLRDFGDIREAVVELKAAYRSIRRTPDRDREAEILATLGVALVMGGQTERGLAALDSVVPGRTGVLAGRLLIRRAWVRGALLGRYAEAIADAEQAVASLSGTGDLVWEARAFHTRAMVLLAMGVIERADEDFVRSEELFAKAGQEVEYADARSARGAAAFARGDLPAALQLLDDAQRLVEALGVLEPDMYANKCLMLLAAGLTHEALVEINGALERIEKQGGSSARHAELLLCAGLAEHAAGAFELAERRSQDAVKLFRRQQRPWWAARAELALLQTRFARGGRTAPLLRAGRRVSAVLDELDPELATEAHLLTGRIALARNDSAEAVHHLSIAARARKHGLRARGPGWLAQALLHQNSGRSRGMLVACRQGLSLIEIYVRTLGATELRALATAQGAELAAMGLRYAVDRGSGREVLDWSERWRATVLAIPPVRPQADDGLVADLAALRDLTNRMQEGRDRGPGSGHQRRERQRLESAVRQRVLATPGETGVRLDRFRIAELLDQLDGRTLVELVDLEDQLYAVVASHGEVRLRPIGPTSVATHALSHALFALRRENAKRGKRELMLDTIGARLESALLGDTMEHLGDGPIVVVPTGRLHAVPWSLLPSLRTRPTSVVPSAAAWVRAMRAEPPSVGRVVLVGGPHLSTGREEVRRLAELYPDAVVLADGKATADAVLEAIDGASLVHVAAHGTFRADSPLFSAIELDDGPLTVYDLERLKQAPYRMVLSSCSSALGGPRGADELLGLVSALVALGSAGVVASVVPVSDPATIPLMLGLHEHLRAGDGLAEALARTHVSGDDDEAAAQSFIALGA
ncbi:CHAT domain-containing tetratricopeptide repeat protein [Kribbella sp. NBC_00709]|uniref:CHAT domain-containing protein n=1 Tax=Kribbella sp. NBC_00709 TaxID=2975972 RepID=UPI002E2DAF8C|nr:CHAT domain-containing tetratricopeptide repeat protein [Kribbella sp. NBC_00709]